jgi:hypothetical protein
VAYGELLTDRQMTRGELARVSAAPDLPQTATLFGDRCGCHWLRNIVAMMPLW